MAIYLQGRVKLWVPSFMQWNSTKTFSTGPTDTHWVHAEQVYSTTCLHSYLSTSLYCVECPARSRIKRKSHLWDGTRHKTKRDNHFKQTWKGFNNWRFLPTTVSTRRWQWNNSQVNRRQMSSTTVNQTNEVNLAPNYYLSETFWKYFTGREGYKPSHSTWD